MYFIKPLFFEFEPVKIANVNESGSLPSELLRFIALYEKNCLVEVLGDALYSEVIASFELLTGATAYTLKSTATQFIKDLVNGKSYNGVFNDYDYGQNSFYPVFIEGNTITTRVWKGFVQTDNYLIGTQSGTIQSSFIADYIYYHYLLVNRSISSGVGQQTLNSENGTTVMNTSKRIERYNEFVFSVLGTDNRVGLYQFLKDNIVNYPTWIQNRSINFKDKF